VALPDLAKDRAHEKPYPTVKSVLGHQPLEPRTFSLNAEGQLMAAVPLDQDVTRFLALQIPEGPAIAQLEESSKTISWSELIFSQPGVINVVGPY